MATNNVPEFQSLLSWNTDLGCRVTISQFKSISRFNPCYRGILIWGSIWRAAKPLLQGFNPCYRGILIWGSITVSSASAQEGFNPCYRGILIWGPDRQRDHN